MSLVITESPRKSMQCLSDFIPTNVKVDYINSLLKVGFNIIDVGSFVSEKAIPQMKDTAFVIRRLNLSNTRSSLMVLVANMEGIEKAAVYDEIGWMTIPYSVSKKFLKRNINADSKQALMLIDVAGNICDQKKKKLKVNLTMAFGNPYQENYDVEFVLKAVTKLKSIGIRYITLSDLAGVSEKNQITNLYLQLIKSYPDIEFGFQLYSEKESYQEKIHAAFSSGCQSFESSINIFNSDSLSSRDLIFNLNTPDLLEYFQKNSIKTPVKLKEFNDAVKKNKELFANNSYISVIK